MDATIDQVWQQLTAHLGGHFEVKKLTGKRVIAAEIDGRRVELSGLRWHRGYDLTASTVVPRSLAFKLHKKASIRRKSADTPFWQRYVLKTKDAGLAGRLDDRLQRSIAYFDSVLITAKKGKLVVTKDLRLAVLQFEGRTEISDPQYLLAFIMLAVDLAAVA